MKNLQELSEKKIFYLSFKMSLSQKMLNVPEINEKNDK